MWRRVCVALLGIVGVAGVAPLLAPGTAHAAAPTAVRISAHRGGAGQWPQNSLLAFRRSLAAGYDEIEADSWLTADGYVVVTHDEVISSQRCPGPLAGRRIWQLTWSQVRTVRCDGQPIPTVAQLLRLVNGSGNTTAVLRLEAKSPRGQSAADARRWARVVARRIVSYGLVDRTVLQDINWNGLPGFHDVSPDLRTSAVIGAPTRADVDRAAALGAYDLSYNVRNTSTALNDYIRRRGLVPTGWGLDAVPAHPGQPSDDVAARAVDALRSAVCSGMDVVITNYPTLLRDRRDDVSCS